MMIMEKITDKKIGKLLGSLADDPSLKPEAHFRTLARIRLTNLAAPPALPVHPAGFWHRAVFKLAAAIAPLAFAGTVLAAQTSLPGQPLYPVKIASEKVALTVAPTSLKTSVATGIIDRRAAEIQNLVSSGSPLLHTELRAYENTVTAIQKLPDVKQAEVTADIHSHAGLIREAGQKSEEKNKSNNDHSGENPEISPPAANSVGPTVPATQEIKEKTGPANIFSTTPAPLATVTPVPQSKSEVKGDETDHPGDRWLENFPQNFTGR